MRVCVCTSKTMIPVLGALVAAKSGGGRGNVRWRL